MKRLLLELLNRNLPAYVVEQLRFEWMVWRNTRRSSVQRNPLIGSSGLYVNVGAGRTGREGWVNVDVQRRPGINCLWDCRRGLPFEPESVSGLFTEHVFEHLEYYTEVPLFLASVFSVLQHGGTLRVVVPDARKYLVGYLSDGWSALANTRPLLPGNLDTFSQRRFATKMELINEVFRQGTEHKFAWDYETLELVMARAGFVEIQQREFGIGRDSKLLIDREVRAPESLYVEGTKP